MNRLAAGGRGRRESLETGIHSNCWLIRSHSHLLNTNPLSRMHFSSCLHCCTWHYTLINTHPLAASVATNEYIAVQECSNWVGTKSTVVYTDLLHFWRYQCSTWKRGCRNQYPVLTSGREGAAVRGKRHCSALIQPKHYELRLIKARTWKFVRTLWPISWDGLLFAKERQKQNM